MDQQIPSTDVHCKHSHSERYCCCFSSNCGHVILSDRRCTICPPAVSFVLLFRASMFGFLSDIKESEPGFPLVTTSNSPTPDEVTDVRDQKFGESSFVFVEVAVEGGQLHAGNERSTEQKGQVIAVDAATSRWMITAFRPVRELEQKGLLLVSRVSECGSDERSSEGRISQQLNQRFENISRLVGGRSATPVSVLVRDRQMDFLSECLCHREGV